VAIQITMLGPLPPQKGISPYFWSLCRAAADADGVDVDVLSFRSMYPSWLYPGGNPVDERARAADVPGAARTLRTLRWWNPLGWVVAGLSIRGDVLHAQWWSFALAPMFVTVMALARLRRKRVVLTMHNVEPHESGIVRRLANRSVVPLAHRIIVHTQRNREQLVSGGVPDARISVVPHGAREPLLINKDRRDESRHLLGLPDEAPVVLFLGNIRPYKGLSDLLRAFRMLVKEIPAARLLIAGQPWGPRREIEDEIASLGIADCVHTRLEFVSEELMEAYLAAADVVVYPYTHFDAQSGAACDALRAGRAIVVTDTGGLPDLAGHPDSVVSPGDVRALASALARVLTDGAFRRALEAQSQRKAAALSWGAVAAMTTSVYRELAHAGTRTGSPAMVVASGRRATRTCTGKAGAPTRARHRRG
jgi:glycosyltransferase involved in cell wall biosynthesis